MNIIKSKYLKLVKKKARNKTLLNGALFSLFSFVNKGFIFLLLLILANFITPIEYGYLNLFVTVLMVVGYFMALSTEGYLSVMYFKEGHIGAAQSISTVLIISAITSLCMLLALIISSDSIAEFLQLPLSSLYFVIGISFFTILFNLFLDILRLQEKIVSYGIASCSNALLNFILSIIFVKSLLLGWQGRVYAQLICFVLYGFVAIYFLLKNNYIALPSKRFVKKMILWGLPIIPHLSANFIRQGCDRYIINYSHSINDVGLFSLALNLANIIVMIGIGFNQSNSVDIYQILGDKKVGYDAKIVSLKNQRRDVMKIYMILTGIIMIVGYFLFPIIMPKYDCAMNYFLLLAIWGFLQCLYFLYTNYLFFYSKTKQIMYVTFGSSLLHLGLSLWLTHYSLYATCLIYVFIQLFIFILIRKMALETLANKNI